MQLRRHFSPAGSSPRVRGTHRVSTSSKCRSGIIPACAGNTPRPSVRPPSAWDHPRVCGEHGPGRRSPRAPGGSSPRVRGTQQSEHAGRVDRGIIPACAGNTSRRPVRIATNRDHPRVCGEHMRVLELFLEALGSSPRVRGTLQDAQGRQRRAGIIPACAGNTNRHHRNPHSCRDHPRVCGEHPCVPPRNLRHTGSSPRVRGTPSASSSPATRPGIIPACAGNTLRK